MCLRSVFFYGLSCCLVFLFLQGCSLGNEAYFFCGETSIELALPSWPPYISEDGGSSVSDISYPELECWLIECQTAEKYFSFYADKNERSVKIRLPENFPASVLSYPVTRHKNGNALFFYPAGCIYPQNAERLSWREGFAANILASLYAGTKDRRQTAEYASTFNWRRLKETLSAKEAENLAKINDSITEGLPLGKRPTYYNPWNLDKDVVLRSIAQRSFNIRKLNLPLCLNISGDDEVVASLGGIRELLSPYIPENAEFQKMNFLTIIKKAENKSRFLCGDLVAVLSVSTGGNLAGGNLKLELCALPLYSGK